MQVSILFITIFSATYFLLFEPDSQVAITLMALAPLSWLGLFGIRFLSEKKKDGDKRNTARPKNFIDPDKLILEKSKNKK